MFAARSLNNRRSVLTAAVALIACASRRSAQAQAPAEPELRWYQAAADMKRLAESSGDQPYGAALVLQGMLVSQAPSRVTTSRNPDAHAEREAIREAQHKLGRELLHGAVLYSTSRPCSLCEAAAARAGVGRMYYGASLTDAGVPRQPR